MCTKFVIFVFVFFYIIYVYRTVLEKVCLNLECNEFIVAKLYMDDHWMLFFFTYFLKYACWKSI